MDKTQPISQLDRMELVNLPSRPYAIDFWQQRSLSEGVSSNDNFTPKSLYNSPGPNVRPGLLVFGVNRREDL